MQQLTYDQFIAEFGVPTSEDCSEVKADKQQILNTITKWANEADCTGLVIYECMQMDSSKFGRRQVLRCGHNNTLKSPDEVKSKLPWYEPEGLASGRMYATVYWRK